MMKPEDIDNKIGMPDIDKEWEKFQREVIGAEEKIVPIRSTIYRKIAAVAATVVGLSCFSYACIWFSGALERDETQPTDGQIVESTNDNLTTPDVFLFDNVEMEEIAETICRYYQMEHEFENDEVRHVRMFLQIDKGESVENIVDMLNNFKKVTVRLENNKLFIK